MKNTVFSLSYCLSTDEGEFVLSAREVVDKLNAEPEIAFLHAMVELVCSDSVKNAFMNDFGEVHHLTGQFETGLQLLKEGRTAFMRSTDYENPTVTFLILDVVNDNISIYIISMPETHEYAFHVANSVTKDKLSACFHSLIVSSGKLDEDVVINSVITVASLTDVIENMTECHEELLEIQALIK